MVVSKIILHFGFASSVTSMLAARHVIIAPFTR